MITSMTGFGSVSADQAGIACSVEVRSVNNRYFKATIKLPDKLAALEPEVDKLLRDALPRGSVVLAVSLKEPAVTSVKINKTILETYLSAVRDVQALMGNAATLDNSQQVRMDLAGLFLLPGVVEAGDDELTYLATHREFVLGLVRQAIDKLLAMRRREGEALMADLSKHLMVIRSALDKIAAQAPLVSRNYHERLRARVLQMVADARLSFSDAELLKEVALFADRSDISEEIARLSGHLDQFQHACAKEEQAGRKLDFITQEMLREANTIASKANDAEISKLTVDIKSAIDRIKEQVQNVE